MIAGDTEQTEKMLCPFLVTTVHNTRIVENTLVPKNETRRLQPCMMERCMAYNRENGSCRKI